MPACQIREAKSLSLRPRAPATSSSGMTAPRAALGPGWPRGVSPAPGLRAGRAVAGARGLRARLPPVHGPDVGPLAARGRRRDGGVVVFPLHAVHLDVYVLVLGAELLDELAHEGPVPAREAVPERELHLRALVGLPAVSARALHGRVVLRPPAAPGHKQPGPRPGAARPGLLPRPPPETRSPPRPAGRRLRAGRSC